MAKKLKKAPGNGADNSPGAEKLNAGLRIALLAGIMALFLILIVVRLYQEQIISAEERQEKITTQSVKRIRLPGKRGSIHTSDGILLAGNTGTRQLLFFPEDMRKRKRQETLDHMFNTAEYIAQAVGRKNIITKRKISRHRSQY